MEDISKIVRYAGDTYPSKMVVEINGSSIDLTGWKVDLLYAVDNLSYIINCVIDNAKEGKIFIYPHGQAVLAVGTTAQEQINDLNRLTPDKYVMNGVVGSNQLWDEDMANKTFPFYIVRRREYVGGYIEEMTHSSGEVILMDRLPAIG